MPIKLDIGSPAEKKTFHVEAGLEPFLGKKIGSIVKGSLIKEFPDFADYDFEITGASNISGHPVISGITGTGLRRVLMTKGKGMGNKPRKEGKKIRGNLKVKGLRMKKTVHANLITETMAQVNLKVVKAGSKTLAKILGKEEAPKTEATEAVQ
jgi:small subunit ribosomal protein S6e